MLKHRVIPCLLLDQGRLVKTHKFKTPKYVGDPINAVRIFNEKEVDELVVLDITASRLKRGPDFELIEQFAGECFMPLCYGGGIQSVEQARRLFALGVEKVCLQTQALEQPQLITELVERFGSQAVVVSIDIKRNWFNQPRLYQASRQQSLSQDWLLFLKSCAERGAGEIILNSVDCDGVGAGFDLDLIRQAVGQVNIPLIALGGAGELAHFRQATEAGASAVAAGSLFVFQGPYKAVLISYPEYSELEDLLGNKST